MKAVIYIAASFPRKQEARAALVQCELAGHKVTSRWLRPDWQDHKEYGADAKFAKMDLEDVRDANLVIQLTGDTLTRGGRHTELGIALGMGKYVYLVGPREQVFHHHPLVTACDTLAEVLECISQL